MERIKLFISFIACVLVLQAKASSDTTLQLQLLNTIKGSYSNFAVDNLGNIFLITSSNQVKKLDEQLDSVGLFNDVKKYGDISSIDVSNPLKILVYYKDYSTIVVLDRFLSVRNVIDLRQQNILQVKAIAQSYDNNIWLFDEVDNKLKKIDDNGNNLLETPDFRLLFDDAQQPVQIIDMNSLLYLYDYKTGWKVFDYYGALQNQYPIFNWKDVQVSDTYLLGRDSVWFYSVNPKQLQFGKASPGIDLSTAIKVIRKQNKCYVLRSTGVEIYKQL